MPQYKNPFEKGRLLIQFLVDFPPHIPLDRISKLESLLPARYEVFYLSLTFIVVLMVVEFPYMWCCLPSTCCCYRLFKSLLNLV